MKKAIVVAHPDDEILFFSSVIEAVDEIIICFGPSSSKAVNDGRKRVQGRYPLKNIEWLNLEESNVLLSANWNNPKLTDDGILVHRNQRKYQKLKNIKAIDAFEIEGDEYVVRDQEGFVAVDRVGKAIKIVDRLDFSRKNFAKEGLDLSFVNTITESRAFRSRQDLGNYTANDIGNIIYAYFLGLILMHNEFKYKRMSQQYASRTGSYGNFNFFRNNGTDLYLLIHSLMGTGSIVQFKNDESSKRYIDRLQANAMSMREMLSILARSDLPDLTRILLRFERELKVNESVLKKVRRLVTDYDKLKQKERQNIVIKIEQYLRGSVPKSELYGILQSMAKERQLKNRVTVDQKKLPKNVAVGAKR